MGSTLCDRSMGAGLVAGPHGDEDPSGRSEDVAWAGRVSLFGRVVRGPMFDVPMAAKIEQVREHFGMSRSARTWKRPLRRLERAIVVKPPRQVGIRRRGTRRTTGRRGGMDRPEGERWTGVG